MSSETFRDRSAPVEDRVADLLGRLTLREKIGQLNQRPLGWQLWQREQRRGFRLSELLDVELERFGGLGAMYGVLRADAWSGRDLTTGASPTESAELTAMLQERVIGASRLGIPVLFAEEAPHGHQAVGGRILPTNIGVAASWRPDLYQEAAAHTGAELRARGAHLALASGLDLLRDPRWGRSEECFGEDPLLASAFTAAQVRGLRSTPGIGVVLKHFAGQGAAAGGRNGAGAPLGRRELDEIHLPAARAGIEAGAIGMMAAYNELDGIPCVANAELLTAILRQEWGFRGLVMADLGAVDQLRRSTGSMQRAAALALSAGVDLSLCDEAFTTLEDAAAAGLVDEAVIDRACARVLGVKIELGLLDPPEPAPVFPPPRRDDDLVAATAVLLQNRDDLLPIRTRPGRVAVIGPNADDLDSLLGDYVPPLPATAGTTVLAGLRDRLGTERVGHERGCDLAEPIPGGVDRAVALAAECDLAVLVLGGSSVRNYAGDFAETGATRLTGRIVATTGEGVDVAEVRLPAPQRDLVEAVAATATPVVAVIVSGRPLGVAEILPHCRALMWAWYPGPDGGRLLAELLMGDREPVGRLPVSLPVCSATLPVAYNERLGLRRDYVDARSAAAFDFGAGIGYTDWRLGDATLVDPSLVDPTAVADDQQHPARVALQAELTNTGDRSGRQLVQLFGRAQVPGVLPRQSVLLGFTEVELAAGARETIAVPVRPEGLIGLGLPDGGGYRLQLWLSLDGPADPRGPVILNVPTA